MDNTMYRIPNRIFVGGIPQTASQDELRDYFSHFGFVKDARIITDNRGNSKGYGFVTYNDENDASKVLCLKEDELVFKESKLNIGHAFRKKNPANNYNNGGGNMMGGGGGVGGGGHQMMGGNNGANNGHGGMRNFNNPGMGLGNNYGNNNYMESSMGTMPPHNFNLMNGFSNSNSAMSMGYANGMNPASHMGNMSGMNMNPIS